MPSTRWNKGVTPVNSDAYNLTADIAKAIDKVNPVVTASSDAERDALVPPDGVYAGMTAARTDKPGVPFERRNSTGWRSFASGNLSLGALYQSYGGGYRTPGYRREPEGNTVHLYGLIGTTSATITMLANTQYLLGTIPVDLAPQFDELFTPSTGTAMGGKGTIYIRSSGNIHYENSVPFTSIAQADFFIGIGSCKWEAKP